MSGAGLMILRAASRSDLVIADRAGAGPPAAKCIHYGQARSAHTKCYFVRFISGCSFASEFLRDVSDVSSRSVFLSPGVVRVPDLSCATGFEVFSALSAVLLL